MKNEYSIRLISKEDASQALEVYKPFVLDTAITFEYDVPSEDEFGKRIETITSEYPWLVCLKNNVVAGYAYGSKHRHKTAYQWSPESTIYLAKEVQGQGLGRILYEALFSILRIQGHINVFAGVALPNIGSESFHRSCGFEDIGDFKKIGYKHGQWHDVRWFQLALSNHPLEPPVPTLMPALMGSSALNDILSKANGLLNG